MDEVCKCRIAEEAVAGVDRLLELTDMLTDKVLHLLDVLGKVLHHLFVNLLVEYADDVALDVLLHEFALLEGQRDISLCHVLDETTGVKAQHLLAVAVGNPVVVYLVVVAEEDDVEARHLLGYQLSGILIVLVGLDTAV